MFFVAWSLKLEFLDVLFSILDLYCSIFLFRFFFLILISGGIKEVHVRWHKRPKSSSFWTVWIFFVIIYKFFSTLVYVFILFRFFLSIPCKLYSNPVKVERKLLKKSVRKNPYKVRLNSPIVKGFSPAISYEEHCTGKFGPQHSRLYP